MDLSNKFCKASRLPSLESGFSNAVPLPGGEGDPLPSPFGHPEMQNMEVPTAVNLAAGIPDRPLVRF